MTFDEFKEGIAEEEREDKERKDRKAFLSILFFSGCRVSEALALTSENIYCTRDTIYVDFTRLKGSKQTDPIPLPNRGALSWLCEQEGKLFPWCRKTGYNIVTRVWAELYPHYFRQNRFTDIAEKWPLATVVNFSGLDPTTVQHYIAKVDIKKVGKALKAEFEK